VAKQRGKRFFPKAGVGVESPLIFHIFSGVSESLVALCKCKLKFVIFVYRYALSEAHKHVEALSRMTEHILYDILYSTEDKFKQARELLNRILKRDLYRIVDSKNFSAELLVNNVYIIPL
jgi:hypothetical protein